MTFMFAAACIQADQKTGSKQSNLLEEGGDDGGGGGGGGEGGGGEGGGGDTGGGDPGGGDTGGGDTGGGDTGSGDTGSGDTGGSEGGSGGDQSCEADGTCATCSNGGDPNDGCAIQVASIGGVACRAACWGAASAGCAAVGVACVAGTTFTFGGAAIPCTWATIAACTAAGAGASVCSDVLCPP